MLENLCKLILDFLSKYPSAIPILVGLLIAAIGFIVAVGIRRKQNKEISDYMNWYIKNVLKL